MKNTKMDTSKSNKAKSRIESNKKSYNNTNTPTSQINNSNNSFK